MSPVLDVVGIDLGAVFLFVFFRALGMIGPALDVVGIDLGAFFLLSCSGL